MKGRGEKMRRNYENEEQSYTMVPTAQGCLAHNSTFE